MAYAPPIATDVLRVQRYNSGLLNQGPLDVDVAGVAAAVQQINLVSSIPGAVGDGIINDTAAINSALALNAGRLVRGSPGATYLINSPLVIPSGTTLDMRGSRVVLAASSNSNMLRNTSAATSVRSVSDAASTATSNVLTSATAAFTSADIGRSIVIAEAGGVAASVAGPWCATVVSITNSTMVVMSSNATVTVSGKAAVIYNRDSDIQVLGGTWDRGANGGTGINVHALRFRRVDRLTIRDVYVVATNGQYGVNPADVTELVVSDLRFNTSGHGFHLQGPAKNCRISGVSGIATGDLVQLLSRDFPNYNDVQGDLVNVTVDGITGTTDNILCRINGGLGTTMTNIVVKNVQGTCDRGVACFDDQGGATVIQDLLVDGVLVTIPTTTAVRIAVMARPSVGGSCIVRNVYLNYQGTVNTTRGSGVWLGTWNSLMIDGLRLEGSYIDGIYSEGGQLASLTASNISATFGETTTSSIFKTFSGTNTVGEAQFNNVFMSGGRSVFENLGLCGRIEANNLVVKSAGRLAALGTACDIVLNNVVVDTLTSAAIHASQASGNVRIYGQGVVRATAWAGVSRAASQVVQSFNLEYPSDFSLLTHVADGAGYNTNGALSCGVGRAYDNGTLWKNIYTGATY